MSVQATEGPAPAPPPPSREPPRVTPQLGSMRQQLAWVKIKKVSLTFLVGVLEV